MATLTINTWELIPLNPDQTDNSFLPSISGTVPTNESVDWAAMGQMMKLVLNCEMTGTYSDSSTANVLGTLSQSTEDLPMSDTVHYTTLSYDTLGQREANYFMQFINE